MKCVGGVWDPAANCDHCKKYRLLGRYIDIGRFT